MADRRQGAGLSSGSIAAEHKANTNVNKATYKIYTSNTIKS